MAMLPFLTLQAKALGISEKELGIIYSSLPFLAILGSPITGVVAYKIGNFKVLNEAFNLHNAHDNFTKQYDYQ